MALIPIAACAGQRQIIGAAGCLPWHFPSDLKFFKETTLDHAVLMGRTTYQAIIDQFGRPLPRRRNLILSRDPAYHPVSGEVFPTLADALAAVAPEEDVFVAGGAQIYAQTLPLAQKILLTHIDKEIDGDTFFPPLDPATWNMTVDRTVTEADTVLRFCTYRRAV